MNRAELTEQILTAKRGRGLSFQELANRLAKDRVWLAAALLGQHPFDAATAEAVVDLLELPGGDDAVALLQDVPMRGSGEQAIPTDPTLYRLYAGPHHLRRQVPALHVVKGRPPLGG